MKRETAIWLIAMGGIGLYSMGGFFLLQTIGLVSDFARMIPSGYLILVFGYEVLPFIPIFTALFVLFPIVLRVIWLILRDSIDSNQTTCSTITGMC
jgi:hypothetical protein